MPISVYMYKVQAKYTLISGIFFTPFTRVRVAKRNLIYSMSFPGSQGVSMHSFMKIGTKLWALEGYIHTHTNTDGQTVLLLLHRLALRDTSCLIRSVFSGWPCKATWLLHSFVHSAKREQQSAILSTPCHYQGPKECPCQVSCRLVQNCGR